MRLIQYLAITLCALFSGGCAGVVTSAHPVTFTTFGDAETIAERQKDVLNRFQAARAKPPEDKIAEVKILQDALPDGLEVKGGTISVKEGFPHVVLGKFTLRAGSASPFWFGDYDAGWRKGYCYPQVPLTWVTLGIWGTLVPLSYPCWSGGGTLSRELAIQQMKTLAWAAGANLVVAEIHGNDEVVNVATGLLVRTDLGNLSPGRIPPPSKERVPATAGAVPAITPAGALARLGPTPAVPAGLLP